MSGTVAWVCRYCQGRVRSTRTVDLQTAIAHHEAVCPNAPLPAAPITTTRRAS